MILDKRITQTGKCNTCEIETGDKYYVFCSTECQRIWWQLMELKGKFDIDKDIEYYKQWLENKTVTIQSMADNDVITARVEELIKIEFYAEREYALLNDQWARLNGRKGIPPWLSKERAKLITNPNIDVNFSGEPRKKEKKKEREKVSIGLVDIDMGELNQQLKDKQRAKKLAESNSSPKKEKEEKKEGGMDSLLASFLSAKPKVKLSEEELQAQADALEKEMGF
jgi:hypothetical protein